MHAVNRLALGEGMKARFEGWEHFEIETHGDVVVGTFKGKPYSVYWFEDAQVVWRFRRPIFDDVRKEQSKYYLELKVPENWLEYRRPLSRDPSPDLVAVRSMVAGRARREISDGDIDLEEVDLDTILTPHDGPPLGSTPTHVTSFGGPYIVLPRPKVAKYPGSSDEALCDAASEDGNIAKTPFGPALLLGTPDNLYWYPRDDGGLLVRVAAYDPADDELLASDVANLPDEDWAPIDGTLKVTGPWCAFDSALESPSESEVLTLKLARGSYTLASRTAVGDDFEFLITRFTRA